MKKKLFLLAGIFFMIDIFFKQLVILFLPYHQIQTIIPHFFYFTYIKNTGGAWSILENNIYILLIIGCVVAFFLCYYIMKKEFVYPLEEYSYSLILGGLLGNLKDRIFDHGVIDYIGLQFGNYQYPIFNFADICIVIGIIIIVLVEIRRKQDGVNCRKGEY